MELISGKILQNRRKDADLWEFRPGYGFGSATSPIVGPARRESGMGNCTYISTCFQGGRPLAHLVTTDRGCERERRRAGGGSPTACNATWPNAWPNVVPFFQLPPEIRKITCTTNAIESLHMTMRKYTRNRRIFPNDESAMKSLYLAIREASKRWRGMHHWKPVMQVFQILFGEERVPVSA